jgi:ATP-dependent DNA ligase
MLGQSPAPMLAQLESRLPVGQRWRYEPKLDGFRGLLWRRASGRAQLLSRNARDLGPWFPELVRAADALPRCTLLDGEIVICDEAGTPEFGRLQERLSSARKYLAQAGFAHPAVLVVFDLLEVGGAELAQSSLGERRRALEELLDGLHPCLQLVAQTSDVNLAQDWLALARLEGVVAKRVDRPYVSGRGSDWIKVKRQRTVDCVVIGMAGNVATPKLVLALRHADGNLHHFAVSRPLAKELAGPLLDTIDRAGAEQPAIPSRWQHDAIPPWRPLPPVLICEVRVTNLDAGRWARFPAAFLRWRPDRSVEDCGLEQLMVEKEQ